jgi:ankyrin repeat protein
MNPFKKYKQNMLNKTFLAARDDDLSVIQGLLDEGADINFKNADGNNILDLTTLGKNIIFLLDKGLTFSRPEGLHVALYRCIHSPDTVSKLIGMGADINKRYISTGNAPLHHAVIDGNIFSVNTLLKHHARPDIKNNSEETSVVLALKLYKQTNNVCYPEILTTFILDEGFTLPSQDTAHKLALLCIETGNIKALSRLIDKGAKVGLWNSLSGALIHHATKSGAEDILALLLESRADVNDKHPLENNTALHLAVINQNIDAVHLLLQHHARTDIKNHNETTPIELASRLYKATQRPCYKEMLTAFGADIKTIDTKPLTGKTEISFVHEKPKLGLRITEIFNFKSGVYREIIFAQSTNTQSHITIPFEQLENTKLLTDAEAEFKKQGGVPVYSFKKHLNKS